MIICKLAFMRFCARADNHFYLEVQTQLFFWSSSVCAFSHVKIMTLKGDKWRHAMSSFRKQSTSRHARKKLKTLVGRFFELLPKHQSVVRCHRWIDYDLCLCLTKLFSLKSITSHQINWKLKYLVSIKFHWDMLHNLHTTCVVVCF